MRIALLSLIARPDDDPATLIGHLPVAGRSLAERQLDLALKLGCERVVCIADGLDRGIIALQHRAEAAGAHFSLVGEAGALPGLAGAGDQLIGFADGVLPSMAGAQGALLAGKGGILVLPAPAGIAAGFERIDLNHAWAGILAVPGRLAGRLSELPGDCDAMAALLRIALQEHVPLRNLPESVLLDGRWAMVRARGHAEKLESGWLRRHVAEPSFHAPGRALARIAVRALGGGLLKRGVRPGLLSALALAMALLAPALAWQGWRASAICLCGLGWWLGECGHALRQGLEEGPAGPLSGGWLHAVLDLIMLAVLAMILKGGIDALFVSLMVIGLLRLAAWLITHEQAGMLEDRAVLAAILAPAEAAGVLDPVAKLAAVLLLAALLGLAGRGFRLTRT